MRGGLKWGTAAGLGLEVRLLRFVLSLLIVRILLLLFIELELYDLDLWLNLGFGTVLGKGDLHWC